MITKQEAYDLYEKHLEEEEEEGKNLEENRKNLEKSFFLIMLDKEIKEAAQKGMTELFYEVFFENKRDYCGLKLDLVTLYEEKKIADYLYHLIILGYNVEIRPKYNSSYFLKTKKLVGFEFIINWE